MSALAIEGERTSGACASSLVHLCRPLARPINCPPTDLEAPNCTARHRRNACQPSSAFRAGQDIRSQNGELARQHFRAANCSSCGPSRPHSPSNRPPSFSSSRRSDCLHCSGQHCQEQLGSRRSRQDACAFGQLRSAADGGPSQLGLIWAADRSLPMPALTSNASSNCHLIAIPTPTARRLCPLRPCPLPPSPPFLLPRARARPPSGGLHR